MRIPYDGSRALSEQPGIGHNRWHPNIPPIAEVVAGTEVTLGTGDGSDGQVRHDSTPRDLPQKWGRTHPLTGPIFVTGAQPGDVLEVDILGIDPASWGWTAIYPGYGLLQDLFTEPYLVIWEIDGHHARSELLPGVAVPAAPFPGNIGVAPSLKQMGQIRRREEELAARGGAVVESEPESAFPPEYADGLRTIPPREFGGNMDTRQLTVGSRLLLPIAVPGALFSVGDVHFAQGDGEVCGTAIETCANITVQLGIQSDPEWAPYFPAFHAGPDRQRSWFATTGIPLDNGRNESMDFTLAARQAVLAMLDWLVATHGYAREAAYVLASVAVDLRLSEVVDMPNPVVSALIPLDIFEGT